MEGRCIFLFSAIFGIPTINPPYRYELANCGRFGEELAEEALRRSGNSAFLRTAETVRFDFQADVLEPLLKAAEKESTFKTHVKSLIERGVLDVDDMTMVVLG